MSAKSLPEPCLFPDGRPTNVSIRRRFCVSIALPTRPSAREGSRGRVPACTTRNAAVPRREEAHNRSINGSKSGNHPGDRALEWIDPQSTRAAPEQTNQMNLTTRRVTEGELRDLARFFHRVFYGIRARDKFGDSGLVGILGSGTGGSAWPDHGLCVELPGYDALASRNRCSTSQCYGRKRLVGRTDCRL